MIGDIQKGLHTDGSPAVEHSLHLRPIISPGVKYEFCFNDCYYAAFSASVRLLIYYLHLTGSGLLNVILGKD